MSTMRVTRWVRPTGEDYAELGKHWRGREFGKQVADSKEDQVGSAVARPANKDGAVAREAGDGAEAIEQGEAGCRMLRKAIRQEY